MLAVGVAIHWIAGSLAALTHRVWLTPALAVVAAGAIALARVSAIRWDSPYKTSENIKSVLAVLKESVRKDDIVYIDAGGAPGIRFYTWKEENPANFYYGSSDCGGSGDPCPREMVHLAYWSGTINGRIWFVVSHYPGPAALENSIPGLSFEQVIDSKKHALYLITNVNEVITKSEAIASRTKTLIRSTFDVYLDEKLLIYFKEPRGAEDVQEPFFLYVYPTDASELPAHRKWLGYNRWSFRLGNRGFLLTGRCVTLRELPDYAIARIRTGQYNDEGRLWEGEVRFDE